MGGPNHDLLPAAILMLNPGINREDFAQLLDEVKIGTHPLLNQDWDYVIAEDRYPEFHAGLYSVGEVLGLRKSKRVFFHPNILGKLNDSRVHSRVDTKRDTTLAEDILFLAHHFEDRWIPKYEIVKEKEILKPQQTREFILYFQPQLEKLFCFPSEGNYIIKKIHWMKKFGNNRFETKLDTVKQLWQYDIMQIHPEDNSDHASYRAENIYDWNAQHGKMLTAEGVTTPFRWYKKSQGYYLENILDANENTYGDLIVSAEAYKKKAWSLFGFYGYNYANKFLVDHPDSFAKHQQAIIDHWVYQYAKKII